VSNKLLRDRGQPQYVLSCKRDISQATVLRDISLIAASVHGLFDSLPDGIVVVNALDRIVLANRRAGIVRLGCGRPERPRHRSCFRSAFWPCMRRTWPLPEPAAPAPPPDRWICAA
jgi:hypothetical protein